MEAMTGAGDGDAIRSELCGVDAAVAPLLSLPPAPSTISCTGPSGRSAGEGALRGNELPRPRLPLSGGREGRAATTCAWGTLLVFEKMKTDVGAWGTAAEAEALLLAEAAGACISAAGDTEYT